MGHSNFIQHCPRKVSWVYPFYQWVNETETNKTSFITWSHIQAVAKLSPCSRTLKQGPLTLSSFVPFNLTPPSCSAYTSLLQGSLPWEAPLSASSTQNTFPCIRAISIILSLCSKVSLAVFSPQSTPVSWLFFYHIKHACIPTACFLFYGLPDFSLSSLGLHLVVLSSEMTVLTNGTKIQSPAPSDSFFT